MYDLARRLNASLDDRRVVVGLATGIGLGILGVAAWWWTTQSGSAPKNMIGHVLCPVTPYQGRIVVGDFVVVQLQANDTSMSEPTWALVRRVNGTKIEVQIVGESTAVKDQFKPLATDRHGFRIGDVIEIDVSCVFDRFRPDQKWNVLCGPSLTSGPYTPISGERASLLGHGDNALVLIQGAEGSVEAIWTEVAIVSAGQQTLSGIVIAPVQYDDNSLLQGDVIEFLRDCVVDARFN